MGSVNWPVPRVDCRMTWQRLLPCLHAPGGGPRSCIWTKGLRPIQPWKLRRRAVDPANVRVCIRNGQVTEPDTGHRVEIGGHREIDVEARVLETEVQILPILQQPPAAFVRRLVWKFEADDDPTGWQVFGPEPTTDVPHQQPRVQILRAKVTAGEPVPLHAKGLNDRSECFARFRQVIVVTRFARHRPSLHHPHPL